MDDKEYRELAGLIGEHLSQLGLDEILDLDSYGEYEGDDRKSPDGKTLIKLMLASFDRYLAANASETAEEALRIIADNIDEGTPPSGRLCTRGTIGCRPMKALRSRGSRWPAAHCRDQGSIEKPRTTPARGP